MTERRSAQDGSCGLNRAQNTALEASQSLASGSSSNPASNSAAPIPRRRLSKGKAHPEEPAHATPPNCPDVDKTESRKNKSGQSTPRRPSRDASPRMSTSPKTSVSELESREKDIAGQYLPKLGRILEGKENVQHRRRKSSSASAGSNNSGTSPRRSRAAEDASVAARRAAQKRQAVLGQRRRGGFDGVEEAPKLQRLANPSMLSLVSGITTATNTSSGSNSTITQKSYDRASIAKRRQTKERRRIETKRAWAENTTMEDSPAVSSVFQYMQQASASASEQAEDTDRPTSSSSSASSTASSEHHDEDDEESSNADEPEVESPMTSPPTSTVKMHAEAAHRERFRSDSGISVRDSSPESDTHSHTHQPYVQDPDEEEEEDEEDEEDEDESDEDHSDDGGYSPQYALQKVPPPVAPAATPPQRQRAGSHDRHHRRLKDQEEELRQHVLQSPQPHQHFQFYGDPSPHPQPALPLIDTHAHYDPASAAMVPQVPGWAPAVRPPSTAYYAPPQAPHPPNQTHPEHAYAMSPGGTNMIAPPPPFHFPYGQPPHYLSHPTGPDLNKTTMVGYELLADKLSEERPKEDAVNGTTAVMPMYRKFEQLNHRVLLHLQDEISELEEELRYLDECIAQMLPQGEEGHTMPASRRAEARYGGELHYRRTDCLGRIYMKLGQYNQALSSYSTMMRELDPASASEIQAYHSWMERHAPVDKTESRFLEHKSDLLALTRRRRSTVGSVPPGSSGADAVEAPALGLPLMLVMAVLPLLAFAVIPGLLGRLFVTVLIGVAQAAVVVQTELAGVMEVREWATCGSIYFAFLCVLAGVAT